MKGGESRDLRVSKTDRDISLTIEEKAGTSREMGDRRPLRFQDQRAERKKTDTLVLRFRGKPVL